MTIYENGLEHLIDELRRIDLIVSLNVERWRIKHGESSYDFQGLYISEDEVDAILKTSPYEFKADECQATGLEKIETISRDINTKKAESIRQGKELRLQILSELFHLKPLEVDALLICLAPELDTRYEKLYSYLQNDVTRKRPAVDLVIKLLSSSIEERFRAREIFSQNASLIKNRLLYLAGDDNQVPLLSKSIKVDERIINYLLGANGIDQRLQNFSAIIEPERSFCDLIMADDTRSILMRLIKRQASFKIPLIFFFYGSCGTGKKMTAEAVCRELGTPLLIVDSSALLRDESSQTLNLILREARLQNSSVYLEGIDALWKEKDPGTAAANLFRELDAFPGFMFLSGEMPREPGWVLKKHGYISLAFPVPAFEQRRLLWRSLLDENMSDDAGISALAGKFKFSGGQIKNAIFTANNIAMVKNPDGSKLSIEDLYQGCRAQSNNNLLSFARKIKPHYTWDDIVLPKDIKEHLKEVSGYIKYKGTVYTDWGFDKKLSLGKGLNILFSGPSGTGKTMAAEIIARDAGLDLYKIDLSSVISKYIGETEKNLKNIFKEAETSNAILFFDEADALFGKRSEVRDSHDRYANIEISYMLQKMEEHEGVTILATNLFQNMDKAFIRRLQFVVEFPFPDEESRQNIWKGIFPREAPVGDDVEYSILAREIRLAGGNIKNIALAAAVYAAENGGIIRMPLIMRAVHREYQKLGMTWNEVQYEGKVKPA